MKQLRFSYTTSNVSQRLLLYTTRQRPSHWNESSQLLANGRASPVSPMAISRLSQICRRSSLVCVSPWMSAFLHNLWGMAIPKHDVADGAPFPKRQKQLGQSDGIASSAPMAATLRVCIKHSRVSSGHQIDIVRGEYMFAGWVFRRRFAVLALAPRLHLRTTLPPSK